MSTVVSTVCEADGEAAAFIIAPKHASDLVRIAKGLYINGGHCF